jgi:hypothetical protein
VAERLAFGLIFTVSALISVALNEPNPKLQRLLSRQFGCGRFWTRIVHGAKND